MQKEFEYLIDLYKNEEYSEFDKLLSYYTNEIFKKPVYKEDSFYLESAKNIFIGIVYAMLSKKKYNEIINCEFENLIKPEKVEELLSGLGKNNVATINAGWYLDKPEYIQKLIQKEYDNSIKKIQSLDQNKKDKNLNQINKIVLSTIKKLPKIKNKEKLNEQFIILNECDKLLDSLKNNSNEEEKITIEELKAYISSGIIFIESIREEKIKKLS